jgi:hypothetical protein
MKDKSIKYYRLPFGGGTTTSQTRYFREWRKAARAVEKAFPDKFWTYYTRSKV